VLESPAVQNLFLASLDEALHIQFGLGHSKTNVTANMETISGFSFDGHQIGKPRFA